MAEHDGGIIVDTDIDESGFKAGSNKLKKAINDLDSSLKSLGTSTKSALKGNESSLAEAKEKYDKLQEEIRQVSEEMDSLKYKRLPTDEYKKACDYVEKYSTKLSKLEEKQQLLQNRGVSENSSSWKNLQSDINLVYKELERATRKKDDLEKSGNHIKLGSSTAEYKELSARLDEAKKKSDELGNKIKKAGGKSNKVFSTLKKGAKGVASILGKVGSAAVNGFKNIRSGSKSSEGAIGKLSKKLTGLWGMLKRMVTRKILQGVIQGVKDGINNLAQYSGDVNNNLSTLKSGLTQLKNSLATAFAPILSVVTPILAKLLSYLSAVITKIGQFFSALTGKSTFVKAVKVQEDYAASLNDTAKSSDKAAKANKKYGDTLDIDEVHDIQSICDDSSSESSGTSVSDMFEETEIESGIAEFAKKLLDDIKNGNWDAAGKELGNKLNDINNTIDNFILKLKPKTVSMSANIAKFINGMFRGVNWNKVGKTFADGTNLITETVVSFVDTANWSNYGSSLSTGLNSLISNVNTEALGKTLTSVFKIGIEAIHGFLFGDGGGAGFNFSNFGIQIGKVINSGLSNIDLSSAAQSATRIVSGVFEFLKTAIQTVNWSDLGQNIGNAISVIIDGLPDIIYNLITMCASIDTAILDLACGIIQGVDWYSLPQQIIDCISAVFSAYGDGAGGIISGIFELLGSATGAIIQLAVGLIVAIGQAIADAFSGIYEYFQDEVEEAGGDIWEGIKQGVLNGLVNIGTWIYNNIFTPFIDGFKKAFGIASPSKVMKKQGGFIVDGLKNGLLGLATAGLGNISTLSASMSTRFTNLKNNAITWGKDICKNLASGISNNLSTVSNAVKGVANKIKALIGFSEPDEGPLSKFHTFMPDMLKLMAQGIYQNEDIALDAVNDVASNISDKIKSGDYTFSSFDFDKDIDTSLNGFSDKIVDSFDDLLVKLQAIAESVTFTTPQITSAVVPYSVSTPDPRYYNSNDDFFDELIRRLEGFIKSIKFDDQNNITEITLVGDVIIDGTRAGTVLAKPVVNEINRAKIPLNINAK